MIAAPQAVSRSDVYGLKLGLVEDVPLLTADSRAFVVVADATARRLKARWTAVCLESLSVPRRAFLREKRPGRASKLSGETT